MTDASESGLQVETGSPDPVDARALGSKDRARLLYRRLPPHERTLQVCHDQVRPLEFFKEIAEESFRVPPNEETGIPSNRTDVTTNENGGVPSRTGAHLAHTRHRRRLTAAAPTEPRDRPLAIGASELGNHCGDTKPRPQRRRGVKSRLRVFPASAADPWAV